MPMFVLQVQDIDASGKDFHFEFDAAWLGQAVAGTGLRAGTGGVLDVHAQRTGTDILVQGHVQTRVVAECVRCLADTPLDVDVSIASLLTARSAALRPEPDEVELTPEDLEHDFYSGSEIVLDSVVREHIILECPMQPLCADDCPGIAVPSHVRPPEGSVLDRETGVDPRLAPLLDLAGKLPKDQE
jgi:uncharacterized protein